MKKKRYFPVDYLEYLAFRSLVGSASLLPMKAGYAIATFMSRILYILDSKHRRRTIQHLLHAGVAGSRDEAEEIAKDNFVHFGKFAFEFCKMPELVGSCRMEDIVSFDGSAKSKELFFSPGKSSQVIVITAHIGNWELAGFAYSILSGMPLLTVMRPFDNRLIGEMINRRRIGYNHSVCSKHGALKSLLFGLKKGCSVCFLADQHAGSSEGMETTFFGHPARTHISPGMLHLRTGIPIMPGFLVRDGSGFKFKLILGDPITYRPTDNKEADLKAIAQLYTSEIERIVRKHPNQWLWAHRRWLDLNRKRRK